MICPKGIDQHLSDQPKYTLPGHYNGLMHAPMHIKEPTTITVQTLAKDSVILQRSQIERPQPYEFIAK